MSDVVGGGLCHFANEFFVNRFRYPSVAEYIARSLAACGVYSAERHHREVEINPSQVLTSKKLTDSLMKHHGAIAISCLECSRNVLASSSLRVRKAGPRIDRSDSSPSRERSNLRPISAAEERSHGSRREGVARCKVANRD